MLVKGEVDMYNLDYEQLHALKLIIKHSDYFAVKYEKYWLKKTDLCNLFLVSKITSTVK